MAYLYGIDVEVDRDRGVRLITMAGEAEYPEAMKKLWSMYEGGESVKLNYSEAVKWGERLTDCLKRDRGEEDPLTLSSLNNLAVTYGKIGDYKKALELGYKAYKLQCKVLGEEHPVTLKGLSNLAFSYRKISDYEKALELNDKAYKLLCKVLGVEHPDTLSSLGNLAVVYQKLGKNKKARKLTDKLIKCDPRLAAKFIKMSLRN